MDPHLATLFYHIGSLVKIKIGGGLSPQFKIGRSYFYIYIYLYISV